MNRTRFRKKLEKLLTRDHDSFRVSDIGRCPMAIYLEREKMKKFRDELNGKDRNA
jgi:hypothetical protein